MSAALRPRQRFADQLRGLALLGIIVVNAPFMAINVEGYTPESLSTPLDRSAAVLATLLAEGKFYLIFSFLFGYSATFIVRPSPTPAPTDLRRYRRRLVGLAVLGLAHAVLLFIGDILLSYALLGVVLLMAFTWSTKAVLNLALYSYVLASALLLIVVAGILAEGQANAPAGTVFIELNDALASGTFLELAGARLAALPETLISLASVQWGFALAAFALGLAAGRGQYLADPVRHRTLWRRCAVWGLTVGLMAQAAAAGMAFADGSGYAQSTWGFVGLALGFVTAPILSAGYVGVLALLFLRHPNALAFTESAGRTSLSVYIGESLVLCIIFCGWGLGWFGELGAAAVTAVAVATWAGLALAAWLWLRVARQGPLESAMGAWVNHGGEHRTGTRAG